MKQSRDNNLPMMFELFPWVIKDLTGISLKKIHEISVSWLSIYLYVSFLDNHLDTKAEIKPEEFLGASILAQKGLINLFKIVNGTKYEKLFTDSLFSSAINQLVDVFEQKKVYENYYEKEKSASGKNKILVACAGALAASTEKHSQFIIDLTNELLLTIQFLDDLADFEDDLKHRNITVLLNEIAKDKNFDFSDFERKVLIGKLISTGSLYNVIKKIEASLSTSILLMNKTAIKNKKSNSSYKFISSLHLDISLLSDFLKKCKNNFKNLAVEKQNEIIEYADKAITNIYLHT